MADTNIQAEVRELQSQIAALKDSLAKQAGEATGQVRDRAALALNGASRKAEEVASSAKAEAVSAAGAAREHMTATSTALLTVGLLGGVIGYFIGLAAKPDVPSYRRWY